MLNKQAPSTVITAVAAPGTEVLSDYEAVTSPLPWGLAPLTAAQGPIPEALGRHGPTKYLPPLPWAQVCSCSSSILTPSFLPPPHPDSSWWLSVIPQITSCLSEIKAGVLTKDGDGEGLPWWRSG